MIDTGPWFIKFDALEGNMMKILDRECVSTSWMANRTITVVGFLVILVCHATTAFGQVASIELPLQTEQGVVMQALTLPSPQPVMGSFQSVGWGQYNPGNQKMIWDNQVLQAELELTRNQRRELLDLKLDFDERMGQEQLKIQKMRASVYRIVDGKYEVDKEKQKRLAELQKRVAELRSETTEQVDKVLLPHQKELKARLASEKMMRQSGFVGLLRNPSFQKQLGMDAEAKKSLAAKIKELEAKLKGEMVELIANAHEELVDELDGDSRRMAEEMLDQYEYSEKASGMTLLNWDRYFMKKRKVEDDDSD